MKLKNYLLINGKVVKIGMEMTRVFVELAGKRVPWFSFIHHDEIVTASDITRVYLSYAYFDMEGRIDFTQQSQAASEKMNAWFSRFVQYKEMEEDRQVLPMRHIVKKPKLTDEELKALQTKVSKDLGIPVNINFLLLTVG